MKQLIRKILKEQDEVINVPDLDFFDDNWEELLEFTRGRKFRVRDNLQLEHICPKTLGNLVSVDGYLDLFSCKNITSLNSLERVGQYLGLFSCENLISLGNLKYVGRGLASKNCYNLKSLGNLRYVGGNLILWDCTNLTSLGSLEYVGGELYLTNTPIANMYSEEEIRQMVEVKGNIYK
jgi:hypothetical protein